jgi:hypothetical protein
MKRHKATMLAIVAAVVAAGCELYTYYGKLGGADITFQGDIETILAPKAGVWYSHYGKKRLDGYTIGKWKDFKALLGEEKLGLIGRLFPDFDPDNPRFKPIQGAEEPSPAPEEEDYFVFYDDTVYGQGEDGSGEGNGGWGFGYLGSSGR